MLIGKFTQRPRDTRGSLNRPTSVLDGKGIKTKRS